ncbi:MAG: UDP-N-acetylmuramoyl-tripeptide--D-alanyl-D-alanine ligase [Planctomycetota bacterium]
MQTLHDLAQATGGRILPACRIPDAALIALGRIVIDSRQVESDDIFWAIQEPNCDGACFIQEAFRRGAQGVVVSQFETEPDDGWVLNVNNTQQALEQWARWKRRHFTGIVIAVTGSVGKTTTRQMIHTVLQSRLQGTASPRNYNNPWGVPLSMLTIEPQHDYAVLELAANRAGEIAMLAELCAPKVGVITQLEDAHICEFGSRQGLAETKAELLAALPSSGHAVLADDSWLRVLSSHCAAPITWVGSGPQCNLRAVNIECKQGRLEFHIACGEVAAPATGSRGSKTPVRFSIPVWGRHSINAALASVAVGRMMGFDLEAIAAALTNYQAVPLRCEMIEIRGATIINDTYHSNPTAMRAALELLRDFDAAGRRIVVCGDMAELGTQSIALHWQIGKDIVQIGGAELVIACGQFARHVTAGARSTGLIRARAVPCDTLEDAMPYVGQAILPGDIVLVKGSRVMAMERLIENLKQYPQRKSA